MKFRNGVILTLSISAFSVVYLISQFVFVLILSMLASVSTIFRNIIVSAMPILSLFLGAASCVTAHTVSGAIIGRVSESDMQILSVTRSHINIVLVLSTLYGIASMLTGETIMPPLALFLPTLYLREKTHKKSPAIPYQPERWYTCPKCGQLVKEGEACDCAKYAKENSQ